MALLLKYLGLGWVGGFGTQESCLAWRRAFSLRYNGRRRPKYLRANSLCCSSNYFACAFYPCVLKYGMVFQSRFLSHNSPELIILMC